MKQQINLYQEQFYIKRVVLPAGEIYALFGLGLALLIIISGLLYVATANLLKVHTDLSRQHQSIISSNDALKAELEMHEIAPELQKAVADANKKLLASKRVLEWVKRSQSEERVLFSAMLEGLGRRHIEGLWLLNLTVDQKGELMWLEGNALDPRLVPEFLAALKQENAFTGTEFKKIKIEEEKEGSAVMRFMLTTESAEEYVLNRKKGNRALRKVHSSLVGRK